jgi:hypothetical protein
MSHQIFNLASITLSLITLAILIVVYKQLQLMKHQTTNLANDTQKYYCQKQQRLMQVFNIALITAVIVIITILFIAQ